MQHTESVKFLLLFYIIKRVCIFLSFWQVFGHKLEAYSEPCQQSIMEFFLKTIDKKNSNIKKLVKGSKDKCPYLVFTSRVTEDVSS